MQQTYSQISSRNNGFIFSGIAIIVVVILGVTLTWMVGNSTIASQISGNYATSSQSHWSAVSGLEIGKAHLDLDNTSFSGDYSFAGSSVSLNLKTVDSQGNALPAPLRRIESIALTDEALRQMEIFFQLSGGGPSWPDTSIIEEVPPVKFCPRGIDSGIHPCINVTYSGDNKCVTVETSCANIGVVVIQYYDCTEENNSQTSGSSKTYCGKKKNMNKQIVGLWVKSGDNLSGDGPQYGEYFENPAFAENGILNFDDGITMNGTIYIGGNVDIDDDAIVGDPPGNPARLLVPTGKSVTGDLNSYTTWGNHYALLPDLKTSIYDSLFIIAESIQNTENNFKMGEMVITKKTLDLREFPTKTLFINGDFNLRGSQIITDATPDAPAMITASGNFYVEKAGRDQSFIPDNVIIVARGYVVIKDNSIIGSAASDGSGKVYLNQIYGEKGIQIKGNPVVWSQVLTPGYVSLEENSNVYGRIYAGSVFQLYGDAYFEGILMAKKVDSPPNIFNQGTLNFIPYFPINSVTKKEIFNVVSNSIKEF